MSFVSRLGLSPEGERALILAIALVMATAITSMPSCVESMEREDTARFKLRMDYYKSQEK